MLEQRGVCGKFEVKYIIIEVFGIKINLIKLKNLKIC